MIRSAIIGCGKISDQHAAYIQKMPDCKFVGACDNEELMAKQMYERFNVENYYADVHKLLKEAHPDIVHITTPGQSHFSIGKLCLEAGCHVYIEKPFTMNTEEAEELINIAREKKLKIMAGHNLQFNHASNRMRELIKDGYLGGRPTHMESYYCYDFGDEKYAKALLGDPNHWARKLPGRLLHNIISHGIGRIVEFLEGDDPIVIAQGFRSPLLEKIGETDIIDELRVIIHDINGVTAYFTFSSQFRPILRHFRVYGPKNSLIIDDDEQILIKVKGTKYKSFLHPFFTPLGYAKQYLWNSGHNIMQFLKRDFHSDSSMKYLIESFYSSVIDDTPLPISYRELILTSKIMDSIFEQIYSKTPGTASVVN